MNPYIYSGDTLTIYFDGDPSTIHASHPNFQRVIDQLKTGTVDKELLDLPAALREKLKVGNLVVHEDGITYQSEAHAEPCGWRHIAALGHRRANAP